MGYDLISIIGATATGKTGLAVALADRIKSEIISADSRQVYRNMDIGTGKDLDEYSLDGHHIPYHLIDIREAGEKYNLFEYQRDFNACFEEMKSRQINYPIACGGTGLYIESVLKGYQLVPVPENEALRSMLESCSMAELELRLRGLIDVHNTTDFDTKKRAIRAIEIAEYNREHQLEKTTSEPLNSLLIGMEISRDLRRERISQRLHERISQGMIDEVEELLDNGVPPENLLYYGLEYKFVTLYLQHVLSKEEMIKQLEIAIHQFSKRQMTWFRGMERRGFHIHWLPVTDTIESRVNRIVDLLKREDDNIKI